MLGGVPAFAGLYLLLVRPLRDRQAAHRAAAGTMTAIAADIVSGLRVARGIGGESILAERYPDAVHVSDEDGAVFGLNSASDGYNVIISPRATGFEAQLRERGYTPVLVDLSELLLGGGGIKCCTLELRGASR